LAVHEGAVDEGDARVGVRESGSHSWISGAPSNEQVGFGIHLRYSHSIECGALRRAADVDVFETSTSRSESGIAGVNV